MDYEATLNQALDLLADGQERKAEKLLQGIIDQVKKDLTGTEADTVRYYYWGRSLTAMDEPEQALLKFERVLGLDPEHEPSLWETASIFLHDLERPESAKALLDRLLPMSPGNPLYLEALRAAEFALRLKQSPPPGAKGGPADPGIAKPKSGGSAQEREQALQAEADALLRESGDWSPEDEDGPAP